MENSSFSFKGRKFFILFICFSFLLSFSCIKKDKNIKNKVNEIYLCNYFIKKCNGVGCFDSYSTLIYYSDTSLVDNLKKTKIINFLTADSIYVSGVYVGGKIILPKKGERNVILLNILNNESTLSQDSLSKIAEKIKHQISINFYYKGIKVYTAKPCPKKISECE